MRARGQALTETLIATAMLVPALLAVHQDASGKAFAFYFAGIALKPVEELLQGAAARLFEFNCKVEKLLDWNEHLLAEPCDKFLSSPRRAGQYLFDELERRREIRTSQ